MWDSPWDAATDGIRRKWIDWAYGDEVIKGTGKINKDGSKFEEPEL